MGDIGGIAQAAGSVAAAAIQAGAENNAANLQYQAASNAQNIQQGEFNQQQQNIAPWLKAGGSALKNIGTGLNNGTYNANYGLQFGQPTQSQSNPNFTGNPNFSFDPSQWLNDPGYSFQLQQGQQALQRAQAAQGVTGGAALKELDAYSQGVANSYYNQAYSRAQSTFQQNYANQANQWQQNFANQQNLFQGNFNRAQQEYQDQYNQFENDQNTNFNREATLAGIGQTANSQLLSAGTNYANQAANIAEGVGNVGAAESVAMGNNFGGLATTLGNLGNNANVVGMFSPANSNTMNLGAAVSPPSADQWAAYDAGSTNAGYVDAYGNPIP